MSTVSTSIQEFYKDTVVFITGATGFVGSALLEKLLRSCQNTRRIYILVRNKKGKCSEERVNEFFTSPFFNQLKQENKNYMDYVRIINGELNDEMLGVSSSDWNILTNEVNVVFHVAATVRFDEKLKIASNLNVSGTKKVIELCKQCKNLKSLVYVSTAYSNANRKEIKETFYPSPMDPMEFVEFVNKNSEEELDEQKEKLLQGFPNTYTYTKCMAEEIMRREMQHLPACVVRPGIVMGPWEEPYRGYSSNLNGPYGIMAAIGFGLLHTMRVDPACTVEMVPVDMLANMLLAAAATTYRNQDHHRVYNFISGNQNRLTWGEYFMFCLDHAEIYTFHDAISIRYFQIIQNKMVASVAYYVLHTMPALLIDSVMTLVGKKPMLRKIYNKIDKGVELLQFFTTTEWQFDDGNTQQLYASLDDRDKQLFNFNFKDVEWDIYTLYNCRELRVHLLKDPMSTATIAHEKQTRFRRIFLGVLVFIIIILYIFITILIPKILY